MENKQIPIIEATKDGFNRYADFSGVSTRSQYWYFVLVTNLAAIIGQLSFGDLGGNVISLITFIPTLAAAIRRMHDVGKSGWFILVPIYNIVLLVTPSKTASWSYEGTCYKDLGEDVKSEAMSSKKLSRVKLWLVANDDWRKTLQSNYWV